MTKKQITLSDRINRYEKANSDKLDVKYVKIAIRLLKEEVKHSTGTMEREDFIFLIDKIFGERLI